MSLLATLPTNYEYFTAGGISSGLLVDQPYFTLNNRNATIYSGTLHYFRVPKGHWRDRLRKFRAAGLNAVETYVPWNLHEPQPGQFDFGKGGTDFQDFLDVKEFLTMVQEEDLFAIVRPGPFICSEWEFGGMPSWLLRDKNIKVRTSQPNFMIPVARYFNVLLPILAALQFTKSGPIIALQVENEYGSTNHLDKEYLRQLRNLMIQNGIVELLFTSDSPTMSGDRGTLPGLLFQTANFQANPEKEFDKLKELQPNKPSMAMEFWTGWFDHWSEKHHTVPDNGFKDVLEKILKYPASVNMYMFHGGSSWGFLNGANLNNGLSDNSGYQPDTNSYDYDAPLSEAGDYTEKYVMVKEVINKFNKVLTRLPIAPSIEERVAYPPQRVGKQLILSEMLSQVQDKCSAQKLISMEFLPINNNSGQSYGYIVYRKTHLNIQKDSVLKIEGRVCDTVMVLVNGVLMSKPLQQSSDLNGFGTWRVKDSTLDLKVSDLTDATLELVVENWGRNNFGGLGQFNQFKGLWQGDVFINNVKLDNWEIVPLEFRKSWTNGLTGWHPLMADYIPGPALYKIDFTVENPTDTFLDMRKWTKGVVIINGFVLGRYARIGPQQTMYLPAPLMKSGINSFVIFEHFTPADNLAFSKDAIYETR